MVSRLASVFSGIHRAHLFRISVMCRDLKPDLTVSSIQGAISFLCDFFLNEYLDAILTREYQV